MQNDDADRQERTDAEIIDAGDGAEILTDGGEEPQDAGVDLPAAHIQTTATIQSVSFEIGAIEDVAKFGIRSTDIEGVVFLGDEEIDELVDDLRKAQANLTGSEK